MENAIAILSDMQENVSYLYFGEFSKTLGIMHSGVEKETHSIWETEILGHIHPDDLHVKYLHELHFFRFMKQQTKEGCMAYHYAGKLRMTDRLGNCINALHRIFYIPSPDSDSLWLSLCLYTPMYMDMPAKGVIINSISGQMAELSGQDGNDTLTAREKQVLALIGEGRTSRQIAEALSISVHTVSRHRQEILRKLNVRNSIEACNEAKGLRLIGPRPQECQ